MIGFDAAEPVEIIDHHTKTLLLAFGRLVGRGQNGMKLSTVAKVKPCHRIDRRGVVSFDFSEIIGSQLFGQFLIRFWAKQLPSRMIRIVERCLLQPLCKTGNRRQGDKGLQIGKLYGQIIHHLLDERVAE